MQYKLQSDAFLDKTIYNNELLEIEKIWDIIDLYNDIYIIIL